MPAAPPTYCCGTSGTCCCVTEEPEAAGGNSDFIADVCGCEMSEPEAPLNQDLDGQIKIKYKNEIKLSDNPRTESLVSIVIEPKRPLQVPDPGTGALS